MGSPLQPTTVGSVILIPTLLGQGPWAAKLCYNVASDQHPFVHLVIQQLMFIEHVLCARNAVREQAHGAAPQEWVLPGDPKPQSISCRAGLRTAQEAPGTKRRTPLVLGWEACTGRHGSGGCRRSRPGAEGQDASCPSDD